LALLARCDHLNRAVAGIFQIVENWLEPDDPETCNAKLCSLLIAQRIANELADDLQEFVRVSDCFHTGTHRARRMRRKRKPTKKACVAIYTIVNLATKDEPRLRAAALF
jgi:hypothetical protein